MPQVDLARARGAAHSAGPKRRQSGIAQTCETSASTSRPPVTTRPRRVALRATPGMFVEFPELRQVISEEEAARVFETAEIVHPGKKSSQHGAVFPRA